MKRSKMGGNQMKPHVAHHKMSGGKRKSNGHKMNCGCPICKNMKKGGNATEETANEDNEMTTTSSSEGESSTISMGEHTGGRRTRRKSKKSRKSRKSKKSRKSRKSRK